MVEQGDQYADAAPALPLRNNEEGEEEVVERDSGEFDKQFLVTCSKQRIGKNEHVDKFLGRLTHMDMKGRRINRIKQLSSCGTLKVLYLYENNIEVIENMEYVPNLTHLYLDNNYIQQMMNLDRLQNLQKLFLDGNQISRITGLENCPCLTELHVANQQLEEGQYLELDDETFRALSNTLTYIDISANQLEVLPRELLYCRRLETINVSKNFLQDAGELASVVGNCPRLKEVDARKNPMCKAPKYWEQVVVRTPESAKMLDGKAIDGRMRERMRSFESHKQQLRQRGAKAKPQAMAQGPSGRFNEGQGYGDGGGGGGGIGGGGMF
jgi:Leucine-rich repeat (LRR) protein